MHRRRPSTPSVGPGVAVAVLLVLLGIYDVLLRPWLLDWGSTAAERVMVLPGDREEDFGPNAWQPGTQRTGASPDPGLRFTRAISIDAPPEAVWAWLVQIGQDRAGFYSYTWLENLTGADIHNGDAVRPEWQARAVGDRVPMYPPGAFGGRLRDATQVTIALLEPRRVIDGVTGRFVLLPTADGGTRLLLREPLHPGLASWLVGDPMHFVMEQRQLRGIKERAEGRPLVPPALGALARLGWLTAGAALVGAFLSRRRWIVWGGACALLMIPVLVTTGDADAALAGFLALGTSVLGFLRFGRGWLAPYALVAAGVPLVLLLAPDAYAAFGLLFALGGVVLAGRWALGHAAAPPAVRPAPRGVD